jgi:hypothetical protein
MKKLSLVLLLFLYNVLIIQSQENRPKLLWKFKTEG